MRIKVSAIAGLMAAVGGIAYAAPAPAHFPGEFSGANVLRDNNSLFNGQTITSITNQLQAGVTSAQTTANAAIPLSQKDAISGVAGLDAMGNVTAPLLSPSAYVHKLSNGNFSSILGGAAGDESINPNTFQIGALNAFDPPSPLKITGAARSEGDWGGSILSLGNRNYAQWNRNCAGNEDAVGLCINMVTPSPALEVGSQINNPNPQSQFSSSSVVYGMNTVTITPQLSTSQVATIAPMDRIYTNFYDGTYYETPSQNGGRTQPNFYYGYIKSVSNNGASTILSIVTDPYSSVSGWRTGNSSNVATNPPGSNSGDVIDNKIFYHYTTPSVFIGESSKQFAQNSVINIDPSVNDSISRTSEGYEIDLHLGSTGNNQYHTADYLYGASGLSIGASGYNYFSKDRWLLKLAGAWLMFNGADIESVAYGGTYIKTQSGFIVDSVGDMGALTNIGDTQRYASLVSANSSGYFDNLLLMGRRDNTGVGWSSTSLHLMDTQTNSSTDQLSGVQPNAGSGGGDITFNVPGYNHSLGIGTISADAKTSDYALIASQGSPPHLPLGGIIDNGKSLSFVPLAGDNKGHPYLYGSNPTTVQASSSSGETTTIKSNAFIVDGSTLSLYPQSGTSNGNPFMQAANSNILSIKTSSGTDAILEVGSIQNSNGASPSMPKYLLSNIPMNNINDGQQVWCSDCQINGIVGVEAYWHAASAKWTDSQNNALHN